MNNNSFFIHETSFVSNTKMNEGVRIYKECTVKDCVLENNSSIGDYSRIFNTKLGEHASLQRNNLVYNCNFGRYTYTGKNFVSWQSDIGNFCSISVNVCIGGGEHPYHYVTDHAFLYSKEFELLPDIIDKNEIYNRFKENCIIGNDVWIGANAVILRNVKVGDGAVIGAGAVVTKDVPPYAIVAGVPAKVIKMRFDKSLINRLLQLKWWTFPSKIIKDNFSLFNQNLTETVISQLENLK